MLHNRRNPVPVHRLEPFKGDLRIKTCRKTAVALYNIKPKQIFIKVITNRRFSITRQRGPQKRKGCHAVETAIRDEARRLKQFPQTLESDSYSEPTTSDNPLTALIEREEREARERVREKKTKWLHSAIKKLPQNIREVVTRVALEGKSQVQVAKELNLSQGWVSRLYERGVEELRAQVGMVARK